MGRSAKKTAMQTNNKSQSLLVLPVPRFYFSFSSRLSPLRSERLEHHATISLSKPCPISNQTIELSRATFFSPTIFSSLHTIFFSFHYRVLCHYFGKWLPWYPFPLIEDRSKYFIPHVRKECDWSIRSSICP